MLQQRDLQQAAPTPRAQRMKGKKWDYQDLRAWKRGPAQAGVWTFGGCTPTAPAQTPKKVWLVGTGTSGVPWYGDAGKAERSQRLEPCMRLGESSGCWWKLATIGPLSLLPVFHQNLHWQNLMNGKGTGLGVWKSGLQSPSPGITAVKRISLELRQVNNHNKSILCP